MQPSPFTDRHITKVIDYKPSPADCNAPFVSTSTFSLIYIIDKVNRKVLLGQKKRGFGLGIYNGYGGKLEVGENMDECARRELFEESGISVPPEELRRRGRLVFTNDTPSAGRHIIDIAIYVHLADSETIQAIETDEMAPHWYSIDGDIPIDKMWPDFRLYWPPLHDLVFNDQLDQQVYLRVDYAQVSSDYDTPVPSLQSLGIVEYKRLDKIEKHEIVEAVVGYWLALAPL